MFWSRDCDGLKNKFAQVNEEEGGRGEGGYLKSVSKRTKQQGDPKLMNIEWAHFLNGPHSKVVGFIFFKKIGLKTMNVPYFM